MVERTATLAHAARRLSPSVVWDRCRGHGWVPAAQLVNFTPSLALTGPVFPVRTQCSILPVLQALAVIPAARILVVHDDAPGASPRALLGDIIMSAAKHQGIAGIVCFGWVRDVKEAEPLKLPLWAYGATPVPAAVGAAAAQVPAPLALAGGSLEPDDWMFGDRDGLVVVPRAHARQIIKAAELKDRKETFFKKRIRDGEVLHEMMNLEGHLQRQEPLQVDF
jgi:regulator of RNase E activity RraA